MMIPRSVSSGAPFARADLAGERDVGGDESAAIDRGLDEEPPAEYGKPVRQPQ